MRPSKSLQRSCIAKPVGLAIALSLAGCGGDDPTNNLNNNSNNNSVEINDLALLNRVLATNADIAFAEYSDAVTTAQTLSSAIDRLIATPTDENFRAAKQAWLTAREPYGQTEVYRFRASPIDDSDYDASNGEDGPEGDINAWPLGEGLIDYVVTGTDFGADQVGVSGHMTGVSDPNAVDDNIISDTSITIDAGLLANTATADDERDVLAGYHAIEFLLWGQDLNADGSADTLMSRDGTSGQRPFTDYANDATCTSGPTTNADATLCTRRGQFLRVAMDKLLADLTTVRDAWAAGSSYRTAFTNAPDLATAKGRLLEILTGMGTLSEGELAGERMQIALSANSQEDEHSCFADNTHRDIWLNAEGVSNSFRGSYAGYDSDADGVDDAVDSAVDGYGIDEYLRAVGKPDLTMEIEAALDTTEANYGMIDANARAGKPVDMVIMDLSGPDARPVRDTIIALNAQAAAIAKIATELGLGDVSDVIDPDASECNTADPTSGC